MIMPAIVQKKFQSTHPSRGATKLPPSRNPITVEFQSTHPSRGATLAIRHTTIFLKISIHAPLAGCDHSRRVISEPVDISIHAPLAGCDPIVMCFVLFWYIFQSTHPSRGATSNDATMRNSCEISIHAPLAGCDDEQEIIRMHILISIHAPLAGCDFCDVYAPCIWGSFQSTHPSRGATMADRPVV